MLCPCYTDISLFDELDDLGDADDLLDALENASYVSNIMTETECIKSKYARGILTIKVIILLKVRHSLKCRCIIN